VDVDALDLEALAGRAPARRIEPARQRAAHDQGDRVLEFGARRYR
jgi:hypothetical protein